MSDECIITIEPNGEVRFIYDDALAALIENGEAQIKRASHVEPNKNGEWEADMAPSDGPVLGPFTKRADAITAEIQWLQAHKF